MISMVGFMDFTYGSFQKKSKTLLIIPLFLVYWFAYSGFRTVHHLIRWNTSGTGGYNSASWRGNGIINYLLKNDWNNKTILTNNVHAVYYYVNCIKGKETKILSVENNSSQGKELLICLDPTWNFPPQPCMEDKFKYKDLKYIGIHQGSIWELKER